MSWTNTIGTLTASLGAMAASSTTTASANAYYSILSAFSPNVRTLSPEERQEAYDNLAKMAALGHDEMVELLKKLLGVVDEATRTIENLQRELEHERSRHSRQAFPQPWSPQVTPSFPPPPSYPSSPGVWPPGSGPGYPTTWSGSKVTLGSTTRVQDPNQSDDEP